VQHGLRALHKASTRGFVDVLKVLIDAGAEKNALHLVRLPKVLVPKCWYHIIGENNVRHPIASLS
jgi:hypothetical protein